MNFSDQWLVEVFLFWYTFGNTNYFFIEAERDATAPLYAVVISTTKINP